MGFCKSHLPEPLHLLGFILNQQQIRDDVIGDQVASGSQAPAAFVAADCVAHGTAPLQRRLDLIKGQQEFPLILIPVDAADGPKSQHQVLAGPLPQGNLVHLVQNGAAGLDAVYIALHIPDDGEPPAAEVGAGAGAEA